MNNTEVILAVDDERHMESVVNADFRQEIEAGTLQFLFALHGREALDLLEIHPDISIVTADIKMPEMEGLDMLRRIQQRACSDERYARIQTIVVTAYNDRANIREAIRGGAVDFLTKPYEPEEFREAIERVRIRLNAEGQDLFIGHSEKIQTIKENMRQLSPHAANILLEGETGTGKSLLARYIHQNSVCRNGPFVDLHCGAVPPALLESELFGHVKGAFTGAIQERAGKFQLADRGTLFLDEINTLPLEMQVKLVKAIEEQRFFPVGADRAVEVNVRIIAASQEPLRLLVSQKRFREDLYHRLNVVAISIPPLRERRTDIPLLAHALLRRFNHKYHLRKTLSSSALNTLMQASWPGNVRVLANAIENTMLFAPQSEIQAKDIPKEALLDRDRCIPSEPVQGNSGSSNAIETWVTEHLSQDDCDVLRELQQMVLRVAWKQYQGNKTSIAKRLGISRGTLYSLLREFEADG